MDIYNYLKKDHRKVADLLEQVKKSASQSQRESLFAQIEEELSIHADTEEKTFYADIQAKGGKQLQEKEEHAEEEHDEIRKYLAEVKAATNNEQWCMAFGSLKYAVEHHVEEEEGEIFEKARKVLTDAQAKQLAEQMDALKRQYKPKQAA